MAIAHAVPACGAPASSSRAASSASSRPARYPVYASASGNATAWLAPIGRPNVTRTSACAVAAVSAARLIPSDSPAMPRRPLASTPVMYRSPAPASPSSASSGSATASNRSPPTWLARCPILRSL